MIRYPRNALRKSNNPHPLGAGKESVHALFPGSPAVVPAGTLRFRPACSGISVEVCGAQEARTPRVSRRGDTLVGDEGYERCKAHIWLVGTLDFNSRL